MKQAVLCIFLFCSALWSQTSGGNARTTGSCSPAVSGNNNTFTITCEGIAKEKAQELTQLMNKILQQQLDPKRVYSELDQINSSINDLGVNVNPLANAPPAETAFLKKSEDMTMACSDFSGAWGRESAAKQRELIEKRRAAILAHQRPVPSRNEDVAVAVDPERALKYQKILSPQFAEWRSQLVLQVPGVSFVQDYTAVKTNLDLAYVCQDLIKLTNAYRSKIIEEVKTNHQHQ